MAITLTVSGRRQALELLKADLDRALTTAQRLGLTPSDVRQALTEASNESVRG